MEVAQKKPAAGAPAAKEPAPTLASGKYTFSKAEALRRYVLRKQRKAGKAISATKRTEVLVNNIFISQTSVNIGNIYSTEQKEGPACRETIQQGYSCCQPEEKAQQLPRQDSVSYFEKKSNEF